MPPIEDGISLFSLDKPHTHVVVCVFDVFVPHNKQSREGHTLHDQLK